MGVKNILSLAQQEQREKRVSEFLKKLTGESPCRKESPDGVVFSTPLMDVILGGDRISFIVHRHKRNRTAVEAVPDVLGSGMLWTRQSLKEAAKLINATIESKIDVTSDTISFDMTTCVFENEEATKTDGGRWEGFKVKVSAIASFSFVASKKRNFVRAWVSYEVSYLKERFGTKEETHIDGEECSMSISGRKEYKSRYRDLDTVIGWYAMSKIGYVSGLAENIYNALKIGRDVEVKHIDSF